MKKRLVLFLSAATLATQANAALDDANRAKIDGYVDRDAAAIRSNAQQIWNFAEPGFHEAKSSGLLQSTLRKAGFTIDAGVAGMPTAFVARYRTGPGPVVAILAEFDALPGISQQADKTSFTPLPGAGAGHACGHNLLGSGGVGAAIAVRRWMQDSGFKGEIRVYGSPAEEGGDGKAYMVRAGLFNDVDVALHWHPGDRNLVINQVATGNIKTDFNFHGLSSHAAQAPDRGRSALEGVELMDVAVAFMRQHVPDGSRIHSIIANGGGAPNVVPDYAQSTYYVRSTNVGIVRSLQDRIQKAAQGAATATETKVDWEIRGGVYPVVLNDTLNAVAFDNLSKTVKDVRWTAQEVVYGAAIQTSLGAKQTGTDPAAVEPLKPEVGWAGASTDVGDISNVVPTVGVMVATWPRNTFAHSWAATAASGSSAGLQGSVTAAKVLAETAVQLMLDPGTITAAKAELRKRVGDNFTYQAMFGDRAPALDFALPLYENAKKANK